MTIINWEVYWSNLRPENFWTERYRIDKALSERYLRMGPRWLGDPDQVHTHIGIYGPDGKLRGIKSRRPRNGRWSFTSPGARGTERQNTQKYIAWAGSELKDAGLFMASEIRASATIVLCAGEKDALVLASYLDRDRWSPVSSPSGEQDLARGWQEQLAGRRVVVALDPDATGKRQAIKHAGAMHAAGVDVLVAHLPEGDGPPGEGKWDVAAMCSCGRAEELERILIEATPWADWGDKGPPSRSEVAQLEQGLPWEGSAQDLDDGIEIKDPLASWEIVRGQIVETRWVGQKEPRKVYELRFGGTIRISRVEVTRQEDPEAPGGWSEERQVTYEIIAVGERTLERTLPAGSAALGRLLDLELAAWNSCHDRTDRARLYQWIERTAAQAKRVDLVRALGPHRKLGGWVSTPGVLVGKGVVTRTAGWTVQPPGELPDLARYRLLALDPAELRHAGGWLVSDLLQIDHVQGGYALPILGAVMSAPLWTYVPALSSWQRYALFVQGSSGIGKTQLVRAILSLWGDFLLEPEGLTSWLSSATTIEDLLHQVVAAPVLINDFKRSNMSQEQRRAAVALLQAYADRTARGRAEASGRSRRRRPPRATLLIDGEDLPEGQQSTLGRLLMLQVQASEDPRCPKAARCATTDGLDPKMIRLLPGVTAAWIAWVQREGATLGTHLYRIVASLEEDLRDAPATTNRSRILRNYSVQLATLAAFGTFLEDELGVAGAYQAIQPRAVEVHRELATQQLGVVSEESASELFLGELAQLLHAGVAWIRPRNPHAGPSPWPGRDGAGATCVGTYDHEGVVRLLPDVAVSLVQAHRTRGGGERIEFSRRAIAQQLEQAGLVEARDRVTPGRGSHPVRVWCTTVESLAGQVDEGMWKQAPAGTAEEPSDVSH